MKLKFPLVNDLNHILKKKNQHFFRAYRLMDKTITF